MTFYRHIKSNKHKEIYLTLFIFPLWSLYLSFKHFRLPEFKNLFWLFCVFLGIIHIFFPEGGSGFDGTRYAQRLIDLHYSPVSWENFSSSFYESGKFLDIYQPTITYLLSIVTGNPHYLFCIFAVVFGFFYSRNIWFVLEKFPKMIGVSLFILTFYYILICPIWEINGVRMWTALHVFVYGALHYLYDTDKSKIVWCFASIFIHFSFFLPVAILLIYHFVPKSINILFGFFIFSFFVNEVNLEQIREFLLSFFPSFLSQKTSYATEETVQNFIERRSGYNFYVSGAQTLVKWVISSLLFVSCVWGKKVINNNKALFNLLCFSLFIYSLSNILSLIPSVDRFIILSQVFSFASIIIFYTIVIQNKYKQKIIIKTFEYAPLFLLFPIIFVLRKGCDYYGLSLFYSPVINFFVDDNQPIIQFIKSIF